MNVNITDAEALDKRVLESLKDDDTVVIISEIQAILEEPVNPRHGYNTDAQKEAGIL